MANFAREHGDLKRFERFGNSYLAAEDSAPVVVQDIQFSEADGVGTFQCWFGPNFGGLRFRYCGLIALVRDARVRQAGSSFVYSDLKSGEEF